MCRYFTFSLIMMCCKSLFSSPSIRSTATCCSLPPRASKCTLLRGAETRVKVRARPVICLVSGSWRGRYRSGFHERDFCPPLVTPRIAVRTHVRMGVCTRTDLHGDAQEEQWKEEQISTRLCFLVPPCVVPMTVCFVMNSTELRTITRVYLDLYIYWLCGQKLEKGILSRFDTGKLTSQREMGSAKRNEEKEKEKRGNRWETNRQLHRRVCFATEHHG